MLTLDRALGTALLAGVAAAPLAASDFSVRGIAAGRAIAALSREAWIDGGFGRLTEGRQADAFDWFARGEAQIGIEWTPSPVFLVRAHGTARTEPDAAGGARVGLTEAWTRCRSRPTRSRCLRSTPGSARRYGPWASTWPRRSARRAARASSSRESLAPGGAFGEHQSAGTQPIDELDDRLGWHDGLRLTARYDHFRNQDRDGVAEPNGDSGWAVTVAAFVAPRPWLRFGAEYLELRADRPAAAFAGTALEAGAQRAQAEVRLRF